jgi:hypothetical protein
MSIDQRGRGVPVIRVGGTEVSAIRRRHSLVKGGAISILGAHRLDTQRLVLVPTIHFCRSGLTLSRALWSSRCSSRCFLPPVPAVKSRGRLR